MDVCLAGLAGLGAGRCEVPLGWAEVTPLWFLAEARGTTGTRRRVLPNDLLMLSPPRLPPGQQPADLLDHCIQVGEEVGDILDHSEQRVMVVVPGDLSPGHRPAPGHPALRPAHPPSRPDRQLSARRAAQFDEQCEAWVRRYNYVHLSTTIVATFNTLQFEPDGVD